MSMPPPVVQPTPARRRPWGWITFAIIVTVLLAMSFFANTVLVGWLAMFRTRTDETTFREERIGGDANANSKVAVVYVQDLISFSSPGFSGEEGMVGDIKQQLAQAARDSSVKAIIIAIDSPGGEVTASDVIHHAIINVKKKHLPVVTSMGPLAASGGYYVAAATDYIVAHPTTLTGSIGVIFHLWNYRGLMNKIGVKPMVYKSGRMKDMLSPEKEENEITDEEKEIAQKLVMSDYDRFVQVVAEGRHLNVEELKHGLADGRVMNGDEAYKNKFVDQLGYFEDAFAKAKSLAHVQRAQLVKYSPPFSLRKLLGMLAESRVSVVRLQVGPEKMQLENGRLYYLPAGWLQ